MNLNLINYHNPIITLIKILHPPLIIIIVITIKIDRELIERKNSLIGRIGSDVERWRLGPLDTMRDKFDVMVVRLSPEICCFVDA
jgi:hypothetical protein